LDGILTDVRYALRQVSRRPIFTVVAALSLTIGVGANTAIFSAVHALLLRPVPGVTEPDRVVELGRTNQGRGFDTFAYPDFVDLIEGVPAIEHLAAFTLEVFSFSTGEAGERITGMHVSPTYFDVMGVQPSAGRFLTEEEARQGAAGTVAVVDHAFWRDRLGADPAVVGQTIRINRIPFTVVGVGPADFHGHMTAFRPDVYLPLRSSPILRERADIFDRRNSVWHQAVGRLAQGATLGQARAQVEATFLRLAETYPESNARRGGAVVELGLVPGGGRTPVTGFLGILTALVALILLVTCANVAGMFLARGTAREREIAVRLAIGSTRGRLVRQLVVEALAVFVIGGGVGAALGAWILGLVPVGRLPFTIPIHVDLSPDPVVFLFGASAALLTGVGFGLLPALGTTRLDLVSSLKEDGRQGGRAGALRKIFVSGQVALSLVLLAAGGLLLRSLQRATEVESGFEPSGVYMTGVDLRLEGYDEDEGSAFQRRLRDVVAAVPGVDAAALSIDLPLDMESRGTSAYPEDWIGPEGREGLGVDFNHVSPGYFGTLGIPIFAGRDFADGDDGAGEPVLIVSRSFAEDVWPGEEVLGRRVRVFGEREVVRTIVGVVGDVKNQFITDEPMPFVYVPLWQSYRASVMVVVRATGATGEVPRGLRDAILDADASLSLTPLVGLERYTSIGILPQRLAAAITASLGVLALLLSALGIYGVVAFAVSRRTREIGVRMALGAGRDSVIVNVVLGGVVLALPGLALGGVIAVGMGRAMRFLLLGLSPTDPIALGGVAVVLFGVVVAASVVPARRASAIDPVEALRSD
jgi:predicted permease